MTRQAAAYAIGYANNIARYTSDFSSKLNLIDSSTNPHEKG
jgi:hypothetical protein